MITATKKRVGSAAAAIVLAGALFGASTVSANAYGGHNVAIAGISTTTPAASHSFIVTVKNITPGKTGVVYVYAKKYVGSVANGSGISSVRAYAPGGAGKYAVKVASTGPDGPLVQTSITVGTVLKSVTATAGAAKAGESFKVSGKIDVKKSGAKVYIQVSKVNTGGGSTYATTTTVAAGTYSKNITIAKSGTYYVTVKIIKSKLFSAVKKTIKVVVK
jgi:hypothetical protein